MYACLHLHLHIYNKKAQAGAVQCSARFSKWQNLCGHKHKVCGCIFFAEIEQDLRQNKTCVESCKPNSCDVFIKRKT